MGGSSGLSALDYPTSTPGGQEFLQNFMQSNGMLLDIAAAAVDAVASSGDFPGAEGKASGHVDGKVYYGASKKASQQQQQQQQQQQRSGLGLGTAAAAAFAASPMAAFARSGGADMVQSASNTLLPPTDLSLLRLETDFMGF